MLKRPEIGQDISDSMSAEGVTEYSFKRGNNVITFNANSSVIPH